MSVNLGSVTAYVKLDFSQLVSGAAASEATMKQLASAIAAQTAQMAAQHEAGMKKMGASISSSLGTISTFALGAGTAIAAALGTGAAVGAKFEKTLMDVRNNTTLTDAQFKQMGESVKKLGSESGAHLDDLAKAWMHVINFGIPASRAFDVVNAAMKSAVATGASVESTANVLAATLHGFGLAASDAGKAMNVLHLASKLGNQTLEQFNEAAGPTLAFAAALGVKLPEVAAAMSALTRHGFNEAEAATQVRNILAHTITLSDRARTTLEALGHKVGVDLVKDWSAANVSTMGFMNALDNTVEAAKRAGYNVQDVMSKVIPAIRGGVGAMVLTGRAADDYMEILGKLVKAWRGELDPITKEYAASLGTVSQQFERLKVNATIAASDILTSLRPTIEGLIERVRETVKWFHDLDSGTRTSIASMALWTGGILLAFGAALKLLKMIVDLKLALLALPASVPILITVAVVAAAAAAAPYIDRRTANQKLAGAGRLNYGGGDSDAPLPSISQLTDSLKPHPKTAEAAAAAYRESLDKTLDAIRSELTSGHSISKARGNKLRADYAALIKDAMKGGLDMSGAGMFDPTGQGSKSAADLLGGGDGGGGAASKAKEVADAVSGIKERIFELKNANNETLVAGHQAWRQYQDDIKETHNPLLAMQALTEKLREISKKWAVEQVELQHKASEALAKSREWWIKLGDAMESRRGARVLAEMTQGLEKTLLPTMQGIADRAQQFWDVTERLKEGWGGVAGIGDSVAAVARNAEKIADAMHLRTPEAAQSVPSPDEMERLRKQAGYGTGDPSKKEAEHVGKGIRETFQTLSGFVAGAFDGILTHQKNWAKAMLQEFIHMVEQMIAEWLVFEAIVGIFGGGAVGHKSFFKFLGFDDPVNDRMAYHQGIDFGRLLRSGLETSMTGFRPAGAAFGGGGSTTIQVHFSGDVHNHGEGTAQQLGEQIAWHAQQLTRTRVGS